MENLTPFLPNISSKSSLSAAFSGCPDHLQSQNDHSFVQDNVDNLLSGIDKENEGLTNLNRKPSSYSEGERERTSRIRPFTNLTSATNSNQTTKLPEISSPHHSQVMPINRSFKLSTFIFSLNLFSLQHRKPWSPPPGWMEMAQAPPTQRGLNCPWI